MNILDKNSFEESDIQDIINSRLEESVNIEFKSSGSLQQDSASKKEMSKDISAFANSDGGIIFYGITELNHVAASVSFIDGNIITKEWIENVIISNIQQRIDDILIFPVRFQADISKTVYVVKIPKSPRTPHMMSDKKYYKRVNYQAVPMEEYEVRQLYFSPAFSDVVLHELRFSKIAIDGDRYKMDIDVLLTNSGKTASDSYKVVLMFEAASSEISYSIADNCVVTRFQNGCNISNKSILPIFPNEILTVLSCSIYIPVDNYKNALIGFNTNVKLYTNSTIVETDEFDIAKIFAGRIKYQI